ncbi:MAG: hypothetical protein IRZ16_17190 [Myxococcaceae bacterium]|nr:hypothetical protein [Myxococcaceae bacterium]
MSGRACACVLLLALTPGCMTARLVGPPPIPPPEIQPPPVVVVLEPFFELASEETREVHQSETTWDAFGNVQPVDVVTHVVEKPIYARVPALVEEHRRVIEEVRRLRPNWKVISMGELPAVTGRVRLVRVVIGDREIAGSNRAFKKIATGFGILLWPLLLVNVTPVRETDRVHGRLTLYDSTSEALRARLLRYPTQPDFAVDTRQLPSEHVQPFALDIEYEEGVMADEDARPPVLIRGFSERLAVAVVALVEGIR